MEEKNLNYLKIIPFTNLSLWDVKRYTYSAKFSFNDVITLSEILIPFKKSISKDEMINNKWQIISKINFNGELFLRNFDEINSYKGTLNLVPKNSIIYSKINAKNGCIYFNDMNQTPFGVSSEYPVFIFDETKVNGKFLQKLLRSEAFKTLLNSKTSGISKSRVTQDEFLSIQVPLPLLEIQCKIIEDYNKQMQEALILEQQILDLDSDFDIFLFKELGYKINKKISKKNNYLHLIDYSSFDKWGFDKNITTNTLELTKNYKISTIDEICNVSSGGTPNRSIKEYYKGSIPWIKTSEVRNEIIYESEEKITSKAIENSSAKLYPAGSLIIAMYGQGVTRGRTAKLGINATTNQACAVLYNIDNSKILTDYLWIYLMGEYERLRELASGNNQPNLNAQIIKSYKVLIPPFEIQNSIIDLFYSNKIKKNKLNTEYNKKIEAAEQEFEQNIFN